MKNQGTLFEKATGQITVHNHFSSSSSTESTTTPTTFKLTHTDKKRLQDFCMEHDLSVSEFVRQAASFYFLSVN